MAKRDPERDMDLDKKIEALRRKNAALIRSSFWFIGCVQEVEEDKKMAKEDVIVPPGRQGKANDLTITFSKSTGESRVVVTKPCVVGSPGVKGQQVAASGRAGEGPLPVAGRPRKKQLTVTMAGSKGKRVVSERVEPGEPGDNVRGPDRAKHAPPASSKRDASGTQQCDLPPACTDLTVPTSPEEQKEYMCWKRERERIDRERVARHKNAKGQWRRAWDVDKTESMFSDKSLPEKERGPTSRGGRNARRGQARSHLQDSQGPTRDRVKDKGSKKVPVVSSKAQGKERLTGRARRWDAGEAGEPTQTSDTTLEEFLEELDALTEPEDKEEGDNDDDDSEDRKDTNRPKGTPSPEVFQSGDAPSGSASKRPDMSSGSSVCVSTAGGERPRGEDAAAVSSPRGTEKRVRFSEELIKGTTCATATQASPPPALRPTREAREASSPSRRTQRESAVPQEDIRSPPPEPNEGPEAVVRQPVSSPVEPGEKDHDPPPAEHSIASRQESSERPTEHAKSNIGNRNTEELIDTGLSVLSLESRDACSTDATNTHKARENGKIV
ncbi:hypothetical protein NHX12_020121 [Muraenolepis orangiensis]|uniref:Coiled-coil domain-containing protein 9B n=1 Tax=Muraenolepis orangiensis TaxID=630683 RepID=A0A9Q0EZM0_9TELE|nr:hypothetical protein NHX12_020121 [Muraenolepis orangiensis]